MRTRWFFASLMAIGFILVFVQVGAPSLDSDGIHYASVAKEIARSGRWLLPYDPIMEGHYYWHLHLSLWPTAVVFKLLGVSAATAKLYSMGMTLLALAGLFLLGRQLIGPWGGWCAGMAFLATDHVLRIARQCRVDLPLIAYVVWAYVGLIRAQGGSRAWYLLAGLASLGAVLTKEVVGLVPLCSAVLYLLLRRKWRELVSPAFLAAWLIALGPPVFFTLAEQRFFQATLWQNYLQQNFAFLATAEHLRQPGYYYAWAVWDKYFYLLPAALAGGWLALRQIRTGREPRWLLVFLWALAFPLGFSLATHKVHYYILPSYAATALLVGLACERWVPASWRPRAVAAATGLPVLAAVALAIFPVPLHKTRYEENIQIAPQVDAVLRKAPGDLIVVRQDVASLFFYTHEVGRIITAHNEAQIQHHLGRPGVTRRYCLIGHRDWEQLAPEIRTRWAQPLLDDGKRYFLVETPVVAERKRESWFARLFKPSRVKIVDGH